MQLWHSLLFCLLNWISQLSRKYCAFSKGLILGGNGPSETLNPGPHSTAQCWLCILAELWTLIPSHVHQNSLYWEHAGINTFFLQFETAESHMMNVRLSQLPLIPNACPSACISLFVVWCHHLFPLLPDLPISLPKPTTVTATAAHVFSSCVLVHLAQSAKYLSHGLVFKCINVSPLFQCMCKTECLQQLNNAVL